MIGWWKNKSMSQRFDFWDEAKFFTKVALWVLFIVGMILTFVDAIESDKLKSETVRKIPAMKRPVIKHGMWFEKFELPDGTSCTLIRAGTHSGMAGVSCNYKKLGRCPDE